MWAPRGRIKPTSCSDALGASAGMAPRTEGRFTSEGNTLPRLLVSVEEVALFIMQKNSRIQTGLPRLPFNFSVTRSPNQAATGTAVADAETRCDALSRQTRKTEKVIKEHFWYARRPVIAFRPSVAGRWLQNITNHHETRPRRWVG
jgi:hypothetical protein